MSKKMLHLLFWLLMMMLGNAIAANNAIVGQWKTIDDETGKPKSVVEVYEQEGKIYGKITQLFQEAGEEPDPVCNECTDHRKGQKVVGMVILEGLEHKGEEWSGGTILDPANGKIYKCKIWLEEGNLKVRGYLGVFFRTQTWHRVE